MFDLLSHLSSRFFDDLVGYQVAEVGQGPVRQIHDVGFDVGHVVYRRCIWLWRLSLALALAGADLLSPVLGGGVVGTYIEQALVLVNGRMPGQDPVLTTYYALLALTKGETVSMADVHDAWAMWRYATGHDQHPDLVPYTDLPLEVRELDRPYMEAIRGVARQLARSAVR